MLEWHTERERDKFDRIVAMLTSTAANVWTNPEPYFLHML